MSAGTGKAVIALLIALAGCSDRVPSTAPEQAPPIESPVLARMLATVDVRAGTMAFHPAPSVRAARGGASAAVYGDQGVTVRIYNGPVTVAPAGPGKKRYTGQVGVRNLLNHRIGDEQGGPAAHNLGIFVFVSSGPTVTGTSSSCSPACTVNVVGQHGIFNFTTPGQRYWFWPEQLSAAGQPGDTTLSRKAWTFEADTQVTTFQFEVLVSAAWPLPSQTRWAVNFGADSFPNVGSEPSWTRSSGSGNTSLVSPSQIRVAMSSGQTLTYYRADSLGSLSNAYIEARVRVENLFMTAPEISFGFDDRTKFIAVGLSSSRAGFMTGSGTLTFAQSTAVTTTIYQTYQLRKYAADSVVLYLNGTRLLHRAYSLLPAPLPGSTHGMYFGPLGTGSGASQFGNASVWDWVIYEIGATQP